MMVFMLYFFGVLLTLVAARPDAAPSKDCPDWNVGGVWGKVSGVKDANNVCVYSNIRYASAPVGKLRFKAPEYPPSKNDPAPAPYPVCYQIAADSKCLAANPFDENANCFPSYFGNQTEDCLFLDVYVPAEVFKSPNQLKDLPVVLWIYGGAYMFGSKDQYDLSKLPFYSGDGIINTASKNNGGKRQSIIYVTGNYRLGAFGWLAGDYMEKNGDPNAGLLDQRAMMQFIRDQISKIGGNPKQVSVWGESAGASSIMHHLTLPKNIQDPLFNRAILMSPAYQWLWDRKGDMNDTFTLFLSNVATRAKCATANMACLQSADSSVLQQVNGLIFQKQACDGVMPLGPAVDGRSIPTLAANSYTKGQVMNLDSIIVSHVQLEIPYSNSINENSFIPLPIRKAPQSEQAFQKFLGEVFTGPDYKPIRDSVSAKYPLKNYHDQISRAQAVITDSSFTCNTRYILDRYISAKTPAYAMDYALLGDLDAATHASDLLPAFYNKNADYLDLLKCVAKATGWLKKKGIEVFYAYFKVSFVPAYLRVFTDHAIWGDPNQNRARGSPEWYKANVKPCPDGPKDSTCIDNLMKPAWNVLSDPLSDNAGTDPQTASNICGYWSKLAQDIAAIYEKRPKVVEGQVGQEPIQPVDASFKVEI